MGCGTLVALVFHNLPSLYPSSICRNDFYTFCTNFLEGASPMKNKTDSEVRPRASTNVRAREGMASK